MFGDFSAKTILAWALLPVAVLAFQQSAAGVEAGSLMRKAFRYFEPLPERMPGAEQDTAAQVELGRELFFDKRLSINDTQSCATCHKLEDGAAGVDNLPTSPGAKGDQGERNTPTVLNAGWQFAQFWDGRVESLEEQATQPILNPIEMAMPDAEAVVAKLRGIEPYPERFATAFPEADEPLTFDNLARAIAAFERTLRTESRFDDFLNGDTGALSQKELEGLDAFLSLSCAKCHDGALLGGGLFERLEQYGSYPNQEDKGRFEVTGDQEDKLVFKVPSLRNVTLTAPYYHDGGVGTLEEASRLMGALVVGRDISDEEVERLIAFFGSLTGKELEQP